jgi:cell division protein FtsQ
MPKRQSKTPGQLVAALLRDNIRTVSGLLLIALLAVSVGFGMQWLSDPYRFPLKVVEVKGDFRYLDREQLQTVIAPHAEGGFFTVDVVAVCAAAEQLPWVYKARVRRVWPDILRLQIEEQQPIARWGEQGFLNSFGESFIPGEALLAEELTGLPGLSGPPGQEARVLEQYRVASDLLAPMGIRINQLALDGRRALHMRLDSGVQLELGRVQQAWQRLQRFVRAYSAVFDGRMNGLQRVDLRYSNGFSVYRGQAFTAAAGEKKV